jgi:hypothetical protein
MTMLQLSGKIRIIIAMQQRLQPAGIHVYFQLPGTSAKLKD